MSGSAQEPMVPRPEQAAEQMRDATERLRDQAWMVAPLIRPQITPDPATEAQVDH